MNKAFFLDRDGTINNDFGYIANPDQWEFLPGVVEAIRDINNAGWLAIVITNQSGVARGYFEEKDIIALHEYVNIQLSLYHAHIDAFYFCPHLKDGVVKNYAVECTCRKPSVQLYNKAIDEYNINPRFSAACGDKLTDIMAAERIGISKIGQLGVQYKTLYKFVREVLDDEI